jgi:hypothetical protein
LNQGARPPSSSISLSPSNHGQSFEHDLLDEVMLAGINAGWAVHRATIEFENQPAEIKRRGGRDRRNRDKYEMHTTSKLIVWSQGRLVAD